MIGKVRAWLWGITGFLILAQLLFILLQRSLIYLPSHTLPDRKNFSALDMQQITLSTKDQLALNAWYKPAKKGKPTVIVFHGNTGHIGTRMPLARILIKQNFGVLLVEYRGYGGNPGSPSENGLYLDAEAGMDFLKMAQIKSHQIVLYGESLGTGVATEVATKHPDSCALILQSPYTSLKSLGRYHYPWIIFEPWDKFDSMKRMQNIHVPVLIVHGLKDKIVPYQQGETLYSTANEPKEWLLLPSTGHHNLWQNIHYKAALVSFISKNCHV